jgi:ABC-2 type transport system ATP-binding protein
MGSALEARELTKRFSDTLAVNNLNLTVDAGEVVGFLGPNGAGKSTTLRMLLGLLRPSSGEALILGHPAGSTFAREHTAYVSGDVALWPQLSGSEAIALLGALHRSSDDSYRDTLIERFELDPGKRIRAYSKGNRQKVALVAAFATRADVLLLDEPTSGLDPLMERAFRECILEAQQRGQAILLSSHMIDEVEHLCARVAMIRAGLLVSIADVEVLRQHIGTEYEITGDIGDVKGVQGVTSVTPLPDGARVQISGSPDALLRFLATSHVTSLHSRQASLEEIFLSFYDEATSPSPTT